MPIRFRCVYCNQLLGIAHRKAGTVVRCPTCAGQVVVPNSDTAGASPNDSSPGEPFVFEQSDFDQLFAPGVASVPAVEVPASRSAGVAAILPHPATFAPQPAEAPAGAWGTYAEPPFDVERVESAPGSQPGAAVVLSSRKVLVLGIVWFVSLLVALGIGIFLGLYLRPAPPEDGHASAPVSLQVLAANLTRSAT